MIGTVFSAYRSLLTSPGLPRLPRPNSPPTCPVGTVYCEATVCLKEATLPPFKYPSLPDFDPADPSSSHRRPVIAQRRRRVCCPVVGRPVCARYRPPPPTPASAWSVVPPSSRHQPSIPKTPAVPPPPLSQNHHSFPAAPDILSRLLLCTSSTTPPPNTPLGIRGHVLGCFIPSELAQGRGVASPCPNTSSLPVSVARSVIGECQLSPTRTGNASIPTPSTPDPLSQSGYILEGAASNSSIPESACYISSHHGVPYPHQRGHARDHQAQR